MKIQAQKDHELEELLSKTLERILKQFGDTPEVRLKIVNYTTGYMGASYGWHIPS